MPVTVENVSALATAFGQDMGAVRRDVAALEGALPSVGSFAGIDAERFGARGFTFAQMLSAFGGNMASIAAANDAAFAAANAYARDSGVGVVRLRGMIYPISQTLTRSTGVRFVGAGAGRYLPFSATDKTFNGTILLAYGTGAKTHTFPGMTSGELAGGWRPDPDNAGQTFKLFSGYNADASGTTPATLRQFSVAVLDDLADGAGGFTGIRVMPWRGTDGVSDYLNSSAPVWGADWDFGYVCRNTERVELDDVNAVGPWREAGCALMITLFDGARWNRAEQNTFRNCVFEGRTGLLVRSLDTWKITATASNAARIAWTSEQYWPTSGTFRGSNNITYTYTSTARDGADLVFNGVTPDPTGIAHIRHASSGLANTVFDKCMTFDLMPNNGTTAQANGIEASGLEVSGFPLRGLQFVNSKVHTRGRVIAHIHACSDFTMTAGQMEGGGFVISSPEAAAQTWGPQAVYDTRNLMMVAGTGMSDSADLRLFTPRSAIVDELQVSPRTDLTGNLIIRALRAGKSLIAQIMSGGAFDVLRSSGSVHTRFYDSGNLGILNGGQLSLIGGVGRINYDSGQFFTLREGTTTRLEVNSQGTAIEVRKANDDTDAATKAGSAAIGIGIIYGAPDGTVRWRRT